MDIVRALVTVGEWEQFRKVRKIVPPHFNTGIHKHISEVEGDVLTLCPEEQATQQMFVDTSKFSPSVPNGGESEVAVVGGGLDNVVSGAVPVNETGGVDRNARQVLKDVSEGRWIRESWLAKSHCEKIPSPPKKSRCKRLTGCRRCVKAILQSGGLPSTWLCECAMTDMLKLTL